MVSPSPLRAPCAGDEPAQMAKNFRDALWSSTKTAWAPVFWNRASTLTSLYSTTRSSTAPCAATRHRRPGDDAPTRSGLLPAGNGRTAPVSPARRHRGAEPPVGTACRAPAGKPLVRMRYRAGQFLLCAGEPSPWRRSEPAVQAFCGIGNPGLPRRLQSSA